MKINTILGLAAIIATIELSSCTINYTANDNNKPAYEQNKGYDAKKKEVTKGKYDSGKNKKNQKPSNNSNTTATAQDIEIQRLNYVIKAEDIRHKYELENQHLKDSITNLLTNQGGEQVQNEPQNTTIISVGVGYGNGWEPRRRRYGLGGGKGYFSGSVYSPEGNIGVNGWGARRRH